MYTMCTGGRTIDMVEVMATPRSVGTPHFLTLWRSGPHLVPINPSSVLPIRKLVIKWVLILCTWIFRIRPVTRCVVSVLLIEKSGSYPCRSYMSRSHEDSNETDMSSQTSELCVCLVKKYSSRNVIKLIMRIRFLDETHRSQNVSKVKIRASSHSCKIKLFENYYSMTKSELF